MKLKLKLKPESGSAKGIKLPAFLKDSTVFSVLGLALILMMTLMLFIGSADERESEKALEQGRRAVAQLSDSVQGFRDRKSTRLNSSHSQQSRMPSSA